MKLKVAVQSQCGNEAFRQFRRIGIHHAFILPALCYVYIFYYAVRGSRPVGVAK